MISAFFFGCVGPLFDHHAFTSDLQSMGFRSRSGPARVRPTFWCESNPHSMRSAVRPVPMEYCVRSNANDRSGRLNWASEVLDPTGWKLLCGLHRQGSCTYAPRLPAQVGQVSINLERTPSDLDRRHTTLAGTRELGDRRPDRGHPLLVAPAERDIANHGFVSFAYPSLATL